MVQVRQRELPFDDAYVQARESRAERCQRLMAGLAEHTIMIGTDARLFDYDEATLLAEASNQRAQEAAS